MNERSSDADTGSRGKVAKLIAEYDLEGLGDELEMYWTADDDRMSLRDLAVHCNKEVLRATLNDHAVDTLAGEVNNLYELLTDDDVTSGERIEAENRLEDRGINVDQLRSDFVSRQAIHTYLTKQRDAEYSNDPGDGQIIERRLEELQRLKSRLSVVVERTLPTLRNGERITLGAFQVLVSVRVQCADCGAQFSAAELLQRGGCNCDTS